MEIANIIDNAKMTQLLRKWVDTMNRYKVAITVIISIVAIGMGVLVYKEYEHNRMVKAIGMMHGSK